MIPGGWRWSGNGWPGETLPPAELVALLVAEARARRRPYVVPAPGAPRSAAARAAADRLIRRYRLALAVKDVTGIALPKTLARAVRERAAACGLPVGRTLVELVEAGLATTRCHHPVHPTAEAPPASEDDEDDEADE